MLAHDIERDGLVRVAAKAADFEIAKARVEGVAQRRRWLRRSLKAEHALVPRLAGEPVGFQARFCRPLSRRSDRRAVDGFARFGAHRRRMHSGLSNRQAATDCGGWRTRHYPVLIRATRLSEGPHLLTVRANAFRWVGMIRSSS
jgi:hypothetical protein